MAVDPAAAVGPHLERRRLVEQVPGAVDLDEEPLAVRAEQAEVAAHGRQEAVDADVPLRQHRMEHAAHPRRRRQRAFVGHAVACRCAASGRAAAAPRAPSRAARHARCSAVEEAEHAAFGVALDVAPLAVELRIEVGSVEVERVEQPARSRTGSLSRRRSVARRGHVGGLASGSASAASTASRSLDAVAAGWSACRLPKKPSATDSPGGELADRVLQRGHRMLVLQPRRRQAVGQHRRRTVGATRQAVHLQRVGRIPDGAVQRTDQAPRMAAADGLVLARRRAPCRARDASSGVWSMYWLT